MLRSAARKVLWATKGMALFGGAVVTLALVFGAASTALGANGGNFILGQNNAATALTRLTGNVNGSTLQVANTNPGADDSALTLSVPDGEAPMVVSSDAKVKRLNADKIDGEDSAGYLSRDRIYRVRVVEEGEGGGDFVAGIVLCDDGDKVLGGGMNDNPFGTDELLSSGPGGFESWVVRARDNTSADNFDIDAICADFPPLR